MSVERPETNPTIVTLLLQAAKALNAQKLENGLLPNGSPIPPVLDENGKLNTNRIAPLVEPEELETRHW